MPFNDVPSNPDFPAQERNTLQWWKENQSFQKLRAMMTNRAKKWSFIDGPITANNPMGVHHAWGRTYKDLYNRFWAMRGYELRYQQGFDCQGLWVEVEVEKEMGFKTKKDIEAFGVANFVNKCKERVLRYSGVQTNQSIRLGYWMDWNDVEQLNWLGDKIVANPQEEITVNGPEGALTSSVEDVVGRLGLPEMGGSYYTFSNENNYMIWRALKICHDEGWLYRGADVMPWCPRCATGISQHEIVTDGYAEITHRSVIVRFPLRDKPGEALLVWTTTPWTLTSNVAAAVGPELDYAKVKMLDSGDIYYLSKGTTKMLRGKFETLATIKGKEMLGWAYDGPFDDLPAASRPGGLTAIKDLIEGITVTAKAAHRVIAWDEVGEEEGTGIVHIAPGAGAEDFQLGKQNGLPIIAPLNDEGYYVDGFGWLTGMQVSDVATPIFDNLKEKGLLYHVEKYTHRYPTCWRCKTELVFRLVDEWFISMDGLRPILMDVTRQIRWIPGFGLERELDWLKNMHDWMISKKNRYWGLALPIWECDNKNCGHWTVVGDDIELKERAVAGYDVFAGHSPHRPYIDAVKLKCEKCGGLMTRITDVGNPWLDAGIVSFSTLRYRRQPDYWRKWYPADWISESFPGQFRNWFYSMLVMGGIIDRSPSFMGNFGYATLWAEDGRPMHKSWGNSIEFNEAADKMGVDVMRWMYCNQKPEQNLLFGYHRADEARRQFLIPLWNVYNFFVTYARLDDWQPTEHDLQFTIYDLRDEATTVNRQSKIQNLLDRWILSRLDEVIVRVTQNLVDYDAYRATLAIQDLIEDLTNWYVRRSRRRFWKSEHDTDKDAAYATLYHVLVTLTRLLAPFTPFVTETIYQNLVRSVNPAAPESIHHTEWPQASEAAIDQALMEQMELTRRIASLGLAARDSAQLKVRQPLARALVHAGESSSLLSTPMIDIIADELNVKSVEFVTEAGSLVQYKLLPNLKLLGKKLGKQVPALRTVLETADANAIVAKINAGEAITLMVDGQEIELAPDELLVQTEQAAGLTVAADKLITVGIDTTITEELAAEGLARELVRRIQNMRKDAGFDISDRITIYHQAEGAVYRVFKAWAEYIKNETLAVNILHQLIPEAAFQRKERVDGNDVMLGVKREA